MEKLNKYVIAISLVFLMTPLPAISDILSDFKKELQRSLEKEVEKTLHNAFNGNDKPKEISQRQQVKKSSALPLTNSQAKKLQSCLNQLSKKIAIPNAGTADGIVGKRTKNAYSAFHRYYSLSGTSEITAHSTNIACNKLSSLNRGSGNAGAQKGIKIGKVLISPSPAQSEEKRVGAVLGQAAQAMNSYKGGHEPRSVLEKKARNGDADAQYRLGLRYWDGGWTLHSDKGLSVKWLEVAAKQGHPKATEEIGTYLMTMARQNKHKYLDKALYWLEHAGNQGYSRPLSRLGQLYSRGKLVPKDNDRARAYLLRAKKHAKNQSDVKFANYWLKEMR